MIMSIKAINFTVILFFVCEAEIVNFDIKKKWA